MLKGKVSGDAKVIFQGIFLYSEYFRQIRIPLLLKKKKKNPPAMQETQVQSLGQEDSLEKKMAAHCSILAGRIPWTEEPGGPQSWT